jgi:hypothetical protein
MSGQPCWQKKASTPNVQAHQTLVVIFRVFVDAFALVAITL